MSYKFKHTSPNPHFNEVTDVYPQEVLENKESLKLIDVRETAEFNGELGHAPMAELVVLNSIPAEIDQLPKNQTIVFICRSGVRSSQAAAFALSKGFTDVYNMQGGMLAWNNLMLPIEK